MAAWRLANSVAKLRDRINALYPRRSKLSDGYIGDAAHATRNSDHNPWIKVAGVGVVRAGDFTAQGIDAAGIAEKVRKMGAAGDPRLTSGGYVIFNKRITAPDFRSWRVYNGSNPHTKHVHVSVSQNPSGFDSSAPWNLDAPIAPRPVVPATSGTGVLKRGDTGAEVTRLQKFMNRVYPSYSKLAVDGVFGPGVENAVKEFQRRYGRGLVPDGIVGPATRRAMNF